MTHLMLRAMLIAAIFATGVSAQSPMLQANDSASSEPAENSARPATEAKKDDAASGNAAGPFSAPNLATELLTQPLRLQPTIEMRGRIETEMILARQNDESRQAIGTLVNGYGFRRLRLGAQGSITDSASWVSEVELAGGNVRLRDAFVGLEALPWVRQVRFGQFREPFSLEGMTSSNFITFLERSPQNVLSPARNWGVCGVWWAEDKRTLFTLGTFRDGTGSNGQSIGNGNNWAFTARLTALPVDEKVGDEVRLIHVGTAISQRIPPNGLLKFTPQSASNLLTVEDNPGSPFLPAIDIFTNNYRLYNMQAAGVLGSFSLQAEWTAAHVQQTNAGAVFVHGAYLCGSYFLTGEHRGYNRTRGSFDAVDVRRPFLRDRTDPRAGYGAVELAARFGFLDFASQNLPLDVNGMPSSMKLYEATLGANWYLNQNTRVMLNYTAAIPDKMTTTVAHIFGLRTAIYW